MQLRLFFFLILCCFLTKSMAESYTEVVFDNSLVKGSYARSYVDYSGQSWVENVHRNLLVSDSLYFTPGNALSLRYISSEAGDWNVLIRYSRQKFHYRVSAEDVLNLKLFVGSSETSQKQLPSISIQQGPNQSISLPLGDYIEDYTNNAWLNVKIPVKEFAGLNIDKIISGVIFRQQQSSPATHQLFLDQIEFLPANYSTAPLTSAAVLSKVNPHGKHVELQWQVPLTPSIRYVKIYRSLDNKEFTPVAIRPTYMLRYLDYVPTLDKKYYYKIAWVDYNYRESPFSDVKEVEPKALNENQFLDLVQLAHINYFIENYDVNSGMYTPFRLKDKAPVSVKETGGALLSLMVGVEKGFLSKSMFINRTKKIVQFLDKAQNNKGFYPAFFDGRKGLPEYLDGQAKYDVVATTSIIEALLIVRQYLKGDAAEEAELRTAITKLWDRVDWRAASLSTDPLILRSSLDMVEGNLPHAPLTGLGVGLNTYMLATASKKHSLPNLAFSNSLAYSYKRVVPTNPLEKAKGIQDSLSKDSLAKTDMDLEIVDKPVLVDTLIKVSGLKDTSMYGLEVPFGPINSSLLEMYRPFTSINPNLAKVGAYDLKDIVGKYAQLVKRRDNEIGVGTTNSDIWGFYQHFDAVGNYRINPAISIASIFLDPVKAKRSLNALYTLYGETLFSEYGFRSWMDLKNDDVSDEYLASNQAHVVVMLENARTGLIWKLYQGIPEIQSAEQRIFKK